MVYSTAAFIYIFFEQNTTETEQCGCGKIFWWFSSYPSPSPSPPPFLYCPNFKGKGPSHHSPRPLLLVYKQSCPWRWLGSSLADIWDPKDGWLAAAAEEELSDLTLIYCCRCPGCLGVGGGEGPSGGKKVKVFVRWPEKRLCVSKGLGLDVWSRIVLARERGAVSGKLTWGPVAVKELVEGQPPEEWEGWW
jgi:hypothetical protein